MHLYFESAHTRGQQRVLVLMSHDICNVESWKLESGNFIKFMLSTYSSYWVQLFLLLLRVCHPQPIFLLSCMGAAISYVWGCSLLVGWRDWVRSSDLQNTFKCAKAPVVKSAFATASSTSVRLLWSWPGFNFPRGLICCNSPCMHVNRLCSFGWKLWGVLGYSISLRSLCLHF